MAGGFPDAKASIAGMTDYGDAATKAVPTFGMKGRGGKPRRTLVAAGAKEILAARQCRDRGDPHELERLFFGHHQR
jgi:hypothetical protein